MLYVGVALAVYAWTLADLALRGAPETARETLATVLACAIVAALWPLVLAWRFLLGPAGAGQSAASARILNAFARARGAAADPIPTAGPPH
jgi:hypothetical protein